MNKNYNFKPYSNNIVFFDTEFSSNDPYTGEILSIGMVKMSGEELYLELEYDGPVSDWVKENLLHTLTQEKVKREKAVELIKKFLGSDKPYLVTFVNDFDIVYLHKLLETKVFVNLPFHWLPIDFASILFGLGIEPESYIVDRKGKLIENLGIDPKKYNLHNALDDAKLLREVYLKMTLP